MEQTYEEFIKKITIYNLSKEQLLNPYFEKYIIENNIDFAMMAPEYEMFFSEEEAKKILKIDKLLKQNGGQAGLKFQIQIDSAVDDGTGMTENNVLNNEKKIKK